MPVAGLLLKNKGTAGEGEQTAQLDLIISEKERGREFVHLQRPTKIYVRCF